MEADKKKQHEDLMKKHMAKHQSTVDENQQLKKQVFHATPSIPWEEMTCDLWENGIDDLRQPGEGMSSRPFFVSLKRPGKPNGLAVVKFMKRGSAASYFFGDRILKQLGARTPGFRFLQPANTKDQPELDALKHSVRARVQSSLEFGGGAKLNTSSWELSDGTCTAFGQTFELLIRGKGNKKKFGSEQEALDFIQQKGSQKGNAVIASCTLTLDKVSGAIMCDKRPHMAPAEKEIYDGSVGWFTRVAELDNGTCEAIMIFEYVKGNRLDEKLRGGMAGLDAEETEGEMGGEGNKYFDVYHKIGEMLVGDLILNNHDRFRLPLVWDSDGNAGNVLLTDDWNLISIDHEIDDREEANFEVINEKIARFLANVQGVDLTEEQLHLPQLAELIQVLIRDPYLGEDAPKPTIPRAALRSVLRGLVRGVFLVANFPRLWYPNSPPGLFEYLAQWREELEDAYPQLERVSDTAWNKLHERVQHVHQRAYPMLLLNDSLRAHDVLYELLHPAVRPDLIAERKREQIELEIGEVASPNEGIVKKFVRRLRKQPSSEARISNATSTPVQRLKHRLGPFDLELLGSEECEAFSAEDIDNPSGGRYIFGIAGAEMNMSYITGKLSKPAAITLDRSAKETACIPVPAKKFAFVYPETSGNLELSDKFSDAAKHFVQLGGYVYWDGDGTVCGLRALKNGLGINFSHPRLLESHAYVRAALYQQRRVFPPTLKFLKEAGVVGFAWICPGEEFEGHQDGRLLWPHGAFAYLYPPGHKEFDCLYSITAFVAPRLGMALQTPGSTRQASAGNSGLTTPSMARGAGGAGAAAFQTPNAAYASSTSASPALFAVPGARDEESHGLHEALREVNQKLDILSAKLSSSPTSATTAAATAAAALPATWQVLVVVSAATGALMAIVAGALMQG